MNTRVPRDELENRMKRFRVQMDTIHPDWEIATVFSKVNLYYFCGTIQDGMLLIPRDGEACLWVKRSYERAMDESLFPQIKPMRSYRDAAQSIPSIPDTVYLETEQVPLALFSRLRKHFPFKYVRAVDKQILQIRSVKSPYERGLMERAGEIHRIVLEELVPGALTEGISEAEFTNEL
ncbi:MAG TPA: aminopeptidase P family N-terminal domain-containing protein, partial [Methanoregulaceae archaeon]|nr:aminopeptidase P family N-terminal domain-containing protein [Methanoregulaceae archaeon]